MALRGSSPERWKGGNSSDREISLVWDMSAQRSSRKQWGFSSSPCTYHFLIILPRFGPSDSIPPPGLFVLRCSVSSPTSPSNIGLLSYLPVYFVHLRHCLAACLLVRACHERAHQRRPCRVQAWCVRVGGRRTVCVREACCVRAAFCAT